MKKLIVLIALVAFIGVNAVPVNAAPSVSAIEKVDDKKTEKKADKKTEKSDCTTKSDCCKSKCDDSSKKKEDKKK